MFKKIFPLFLFLFFPIKIGSIPGNPGGFLRIVDAVKGPFYPKPPPFPTFLDTDFKWEEKDLYAPAGEKDKLDYAIPEDLL